MQIKFSLESHPLEGVDPVIYKTRFSLRGNDITSINTQTLDLLSLESSDLFQKFYEI
ncbi:MAG: hypothetical protein RLZZ59_727 [Pseudomonadota bacterium]|jgi:hypothetical protein